MSACRGTRDHNILSPDQKRYELPTNDSLSPYPKPSMKAREGDTAKLKIGGACHHCGEENVREFPHVCVSGEWDDKNNKFDVTIRLVIIATPKPGSVKRKDGGK